MITEGKQYMRLRGLHRQSLRWLAVAVPLVLLLVAARPATTQGADKRTAAEVLDAMSRKYQDFKTYRDSGIVKTTYINPDRTFSREISFKTAFVRPDRFRFEFTDDSHDRYIVWRSEQKVKTWWDLKSSIEDQPSLDMALGGATGISMLAAHTIPVLLMPSEISGFTLKDLKEIVRLQDSTCGDFKCILIRGKNHQGNLITLWIESGNLLLRQHHWSASLERVQIEVTTTYTPTVNGQIPEEMLAFSAPVQSK
jgi:hypothetical protein